MTSPLDRAKLAGIRPSDAPHNSTVQPVLPVSTSTTKENHMSTEQTPATETSAPATVAVDAATLSAMLATMQQQSAQIAALTAQVQQQQSAPASVAPPDNPQPKKPAWFLPPPPKAPFIPKEVSCYAPCIKDEKTNQLTDTPNGTLCLSLGTHSKIAFIPDVWFRAGGVLEYFESGQAREDLQHVHKTGEKTKFEF